MGRGEDKRFLDSPEWSEALDQRQRTQLLRETTLWNKLLRLMAVWLWLVRSLGKMHMGDSTVDRFEICYHVELVASSLREMGKILKTSLEQGECATTVSSAWADPRVPLVFDCEDFETARLYAFHSGYLIAINRMLEILHGLFILEEIQDAC